MTEREEKIIIEGNPENEKNWVRDRFMETDLISRIEEAKEGSRELDCLIWAHLDDRTVRYTDNKLVLAKSNKPPHDECLLGFIDPGKQSRNFTTSRDDIPHYTASLDAALTLIPEGLWWVLNSGRENGTAIALIQRDIEFSAATPELALCGAALKAIKEKSDG